MEICNTNRTAVSSAEVLCAGLKKPLISILYGHILFMWSNRCYSTKMFYLNPYFDDTLPIKAHIYEGFIAVRNVVLYHYSRY